MKKALVAYFSASGVTQRLAKTVAEAAGADLFEIEPVQKYTSEDLDWTDKKKPFYSGNERSVIPSGNRRACGSHGSIRYGICRISDLVV